MTGKANKILVFLVLNFVVIFHFVQASEVNVNFVYTETGLRDPFVPSDLVTNEALPKDSGNFLSQKSLKLEGIMWDPDDPYVIINDEILRVGDEIEGVTILKIEKESVTFGYKDKTVVMPLIGKGE